MGLLDGLARVGRTLFARRRGGARIVGPYDATPARRSRTCRLEVMEPRAMLTAAPILLGVVYMEDDSGSDAKPDTFWVSFLGGAEGTRLGRLVIDGDQDGSGTLSRGDIIFDTAEGGLGVMQAHPPRFRNDLSDDVGAVSVLYADGGSRIEIEFDNFTAGKRIVFTVDSDEVVRVLHATDVDRINAGIDSIVSGVEFAGNLLTAEFVAPHFYAVDGTELFEFDYDPLLAGTGLNLPGDADTGHPNRTAGAVIELQQVPLPITISGTVFKDPNMNVRQDAGEMGLAGIELTLRQVVGSSYVSTGHTVLSAADGSYRFEGVHILPGTYQVVMTAPSGPLFPVGAAAGTVDGQTRGTATSALAIGGIVLLGGQDSIENNFALALPGSLSGWVYVDANNNGLRNPGETGIGGVVLHLLDADGNRTGQSVLSASDSARLGYYEFVDLYPGVYGVEQEHPAAFDDGIDTPGSAGGAALAPPGDRITGAVIGSEVHATAYNFGELIPPGSFSGYVHANIDNDCHSSHNPPIAGVTIHLLDGAGNILRTTQTDEHGYYEFTLLPPGTYGVQQQQPGGYFHGSQSIGSGTGQITADDRIDDILVQSRVYLVDYNFCDVPPSGISGWVYVDANNNGLRDPGETGIGGVVLHLLDADGNRTGQSVLAANDPARLGYYEFVDLFPGVYGVEQEHPAAFDDGIDTPGSAGGTALPPPGDRITGAQLRPATVETDYNFGELIPPGSISGYVHANIDGDCHSSHNPPIAGVTIHLLDAAGNILRTTQTDEHGYYEFTLLPPGTYGVQQQQPGGYFHGSQSIGSGTGQITADDRIDGIVVQSRVYLVDYNFCDVPPSGLSGWVYVDANNNGLRDPGETGIGGVVLHLLDADGNRTGQSVLAANDPARLGYYEFVDLFPGVYGVEQEHPTWYRDGKDSPGSAGGTALPPPGDRITGAQLRPAIVETDYNFGELLPLGSVCGFVFADMNQNGVYDSGESRIAGVTIELIDQTTGSVLRSTTTDANGAYCFEVEAGVYGVRQRQPEGYFHGGQSVGDGGGVVLEDDWLGQIDVPAGQHLENYLFAEIPPAQLSGVVFQDGPAILVLGGVVTDPAALQLQRDGRLKPTDQRLAGVELQLRDGQTGAPILGNAALGGTYAAGEPITVRTDAQGRYAFVGLRPGIYSVFQVQPAGYFDGRDTPGTHGGTAMNPHDTVDGFAHARLLVPHHHDAIIGIELSAGEDARNYHFSEIAVEPLVFWFGPDRPAAAVPPPAAPYWILPPEPMPLPALLADPPARLRLYGTGPVMFTWHLSIIDGGYPRGRYHRDDLVAQFASIRMDVVAFSVQNLRQSTWRLPDDVEDQRRRLLFGFPHGTPVAGDFNGDGITNVGIFYKGQWFIDVNGNGVWDDGDLWIKLGQQWDRPVVGDFNGDGKADIGIFGPAWHGDRRALEVEPGLPTSLNPPSGVEKNLPRSRPDTPLGLRALKLTSEGRLRADVIDHVFHFGTAQDLPLAGDWNGDGIKTIAVFRSGRWHLDVDGNGRWKSNDASFSFGAHGDIPIAGDWTGEGIDRVGVFRRGVAILDTNGNRRLDPEDRVLDLGSPDAIPVVGDWNGDGIDTIALYHDGAVEEPAPQAD